MAYEPRRVSHEPLFAGLHNVEIDDTILKDLYSFSQDKNTEATFYFPELLTDPTTAPGPGLTLHGFRSIVSYALIRTLTNIDTAFATPLITMIGNSVLYDKGSTNTSVIRKNNKSFYGILNHKNLHTTYNLQTAKQAAINARAHYTNSQDFIVNEYKFDREALLRAYNSKYNQQQKNMERRSDVPLYKLKSYGLFSPESRDNFITTTRQIITLTPELEVLIIPLGLYPFNYTSKYENNIMVKTIGHAQYIIINIPQKMYMIIDGQLDTSRTTRENMRIQLEKLDPFIKEIMGEQFEPYLYSIECPQAVVLDKNCIWWSMLVVFLFLQSDPKIVNYGNILLQLKNAGSGDKEFLIRVLNAFKIHVLKMLATMLNNGSLEWSDLDVFFTKHMPEISPDSRARANAHEALNRAAWEAYMESQRQERDKRMGIIRRNTTLGGPAMIAPMAVGGRTRKLKTSSRRARCTHKHKHGKLLRKSSRRAPH